MLNPGIMKKVPLCALSVCLAAFLSALPAQSRGQNPVLARVEAVERVDRIGLPVYAHLQDAKGRAYALVVATEAALEQAGWPFTVLALEPDIANLALAIERLPGARERAREQVEVIYDDGLRFIVAGPPEQAARLAGLGMAVIRINAPLAWPSDPEGRAASLRARGTIQADAAISNVMNLVCMNAISNLTAMLDGEKEAVIEGSPYTILTRHTASGTPIRQHASHSSVW